jgi:hypothetical protein
MPSAGTSQQAWTSKNGSGPLGDVGAKIDEIKSGGPKGFFGIDQIDWGGRGGAIYEVWKCSPQCGSPVNVKSACLCLLTWHFCCPCAEAHLYASSLSQPCACVPHVLMGFFCAPCTHCFTRYNLRKRNGVAGNICGDCVCTYLCGCCSSLQMMRAVAPSDWSLIEPTPQCVAVAPTVILLK